LLFNSLHFLVFFPTVVTLYFLMPAAHRWALLLLASCYFYMALIPEYILVLFALIGIDYACALVIDASGGAKRRAWLVFSLAANLLMLGTFKYYDFLQANTSQLLAFLGIPYRPERLGMALPIGLSFHTFQSMSYTIEVYRGHQKAERHLGIYAVYVLFFPQMVAGPIERPQNLLHQFREPHLFSYDRATRGLQLMLWGMFKKVVIADRLSGPVDLVYGDPHLYSPFQLLLATYFFSVQIYCDFSGYSNIARGSAEVLGIKLMRNFERPYSSKSISEFWRRWHISLSTWFRDYVYLPLGGNRTSLPRRSLNVMAVFTLSGLWHGANWTFAAWGALHGVYLLVGILLDQKGSWIQLMGRFPRLKKAGAVFLTYHLVLLSWVFFRARNVSDAMYIVNQIFRGFHFSVTDVKSLLLSHELLGVGVAVLMLEAYEYWERLGDVRDSLRLKPTWQRWTAHYAVVLMIVLAGKYGSETFIYFQF
jgi:D-alanyl-lipoteichoic acid acyltransferase DltB (MBOAT superfamily)